MYHLMEKLAECQLIFFEITTLYLSVESNYICHLHKISYNLNPFRKDLQALEIALSEVKPTFVLSGQRVITLHNQ